MKTIKEMIEVMQAYDKGEQIQILDINGIWEDKEYPYWNWAGCDYRVKTKKIYVPFENGEEFLAAQRKHGEFVENKESGEKMNAYIDKNGIVILVTALDCTHTFESLASLFGYYKFSDGTPCGKEVDVCQH